MRIWDIHPGYLNRESLLGEHREVHAVLSVIQNHKTGYARHPETMRWRGCLGALVLRHDIIAAEMRLRGYNHFSPAPDLRETAWPGVFVDPPERQFAILSEKYREKSAGRIPLPRNAQQLWAQHKYSILARDPGLYRTIGRETARREGEEYFHELARTLTMSLRTGPQPGDS